MIILRGLIILSLFLPGDARRSFRIEDSRHDAQQQIKTLTKDFEVSTEGKDALLPAGIKRALFRKGEKLLPQGNALPRFPSATMNLKPYWRPGYDSNDEHWYKSREVRYTDGWGDEGNDRRSKDLRHEGSATAASPSQWASWSPPAPRSWDLHNGGSATAAAPSTPSAAAAPSTTHAPEVAQVAGAAASELVGGKGFGGAEATRDGGSEADPDKKYADKYDGEHWYASREVRYTDGWGDEGEDRRSKDLRHGGSATAAAPSQWASWSPPAPRSWDRPLDRSA